MDCTQPTVVDARVWLAIKPPSDPLASTAWSLAHAHQAPWLVNHGLRTYAWGQALAVIGDLRPDTPCLFAAAMLHDAGLTAQAAHPGDHCFALRGARYARAALVGSADARRVENVAQAIARHLDFQVPVRDGVEAHLLQAGAMVDVLGRGLARISPSVRQQVLEAHPRLKMKVELCRCMREQVARSPQSRIGFYARKIGFIELIQRAPFEE